MGFEYYGYVSAKVSKLGEMPFMKSNRKSRVERTKQPIHFVRTMLIMCVASALVLTYSLVAMAYGNT